MIIISKHGMKGKFSTKRKANQKFKTKKSTQFPSDDSLDTISSVINEPTE
jgi:hypothetical protein